MVINCEQLMRALESRQAVARARSQRAIVVVSDTPPGWLRLLEDQYGFHVESSEQTDQPTDRADRITAILGTENQRAVYQLGEQPDAGILAALAGSIRIGGILLLDLGQSIGPSDFSRAARSINNQDVSNSRKRFNRLITRYMNDEPSLFTRLDIDPEFSCSKCGETSITRQSLFPVDFNQQHAATAISEQEQLLVHAKKHLANHQSSSILISGRRGRGKSALLAQIATWLDTQGKDFAITSNHKAALQSYRKHYSGENDRFISHIDALRRSHEVLLVDEAGNFSIKQLNRYATNNNHIVFASTTEGYENAGKAFAVRFAEQLKSLPKPHLNLQLKQPWRWNAGDQLEQFIDELSLANQPAHDEPPIRMLDNSLPKKNTYICLEVTQEQLANSEKLLLQVYTLLAENHYQSSAKDLQHLLDGRSLRVWIQTLNGHVVGALVTELEGNISVDLHTAIINGERRLRHQLLPQLLAKQSRDTSVLTKRFARVVRIAVVPELRRHGLATSMLRHVEEELMNNNPTISAIGASFANDLASMAFWIHNGYQRFHQGFKINPRSGTNSVAVLKSNDSHIMNAVKKSELTNSN